MVLLRPRVRVSFEEAGSAFKEIYREQLNRTAKTTHKLLNPKVFCCRVNRCCWEKQPIYAHFCFVELKRGVNERKFLSKSCEIEREREMDLIGDGALMTNTKSPKGRR